MPQEISNFEPNPAADSLLIGLKLRIKSDELKAHCKARSDHHRQRAKEKEDELPKLKESLDRIARTKPAQDVSHMNKMSSGYSLDPDESIKELEKDIRDHHNRVLSFAYFAEHLFAQDYILDEADLIRLEILKR